jgi:hypothetical protein
MSKKAKFTLARSPRTGQLEWAPPKEHLGQSLFGWLMLAASTLVFVLVAGYFACAFVLSTPGVDLTHLPGGGSSAMGQEVQQLKQADGRH